MAWTQETAPATVKQVRSLYLRKKEV